MDAVSTGHLRDEFLPCFGILSTNFRLPQALYAWWRYGLEIFIVGVVLTEIKKARHMQALLRPTGGYGMQRLMGLSAWRTAMFW